MARLEELIMGRWTDQERMVWWEGSWISAPLFLERIRRLRGELEAGGFSAGDRLATLLPVCPAYLALSVAVWSLGGTIIPLNGGATPQAMIPALRASGANVIAAASPEAVGAYAAQGIELTLVSLEGEFLSRPAYRPTFKTPEDWAVVFFTSGTTGDPKGVPLTHGNVIANVQTARRHALRPESDDEVLFNVLPNFHAFGCVVSGYLPLVVGFGQATHPAFLPVAKTLEALDASGATVAVVVPTMLHFLSGVALKTGLIPRRLKLVICGGDKLSGALETRVRAGLPMLRLVEGYGLTEASPVLAVTAWDKEHRTGSVGQLFENVEYRLTDREGNPVPGDEGMLWVRGPSVITSYLGGSEENKKRFVDGWLNTGDLVRVEEDRTVTILERVSDLIIVGGFNVYPQEVEAVLVQHPAVASAGVVGCTQSVSGEVIRGYVTLNEGASVADGELVDWCRTRLPHFKQPRRVEVLDALPTNALGKVLRRKLRELCNQ